MQQAEHRSVGSVAGRTSEFPARPNSIDALVVVQRWLD